MSARSPTLQEVDRHAVGELHHVERPVARRARRPRASRTTNVAEACGSGAWAMVWFSCTAIAAILPARAKAIISRCRYSAITVCFGVRGNHLIRECRRRAGLTQAQLAERIVTTQPAIARLEAVVEPHAPTPVRHRVRLRLRGPPDGHPGRRLGVVDGAGQRFDSLRPSGWRRRWTLPGWRGLPRRCDKAPAERSAGVSARPRVLRPGAHAPSARPPWGALVAIGGFAANYHGSVHVTFDLDITPDRSIENLDRLSAALIELGAKVRARGVDPLPFDHDGRSLARVDVWNLTTPHGDLDVSFAPSGTRGYGDLHERSEVQTCSASRSSRLARRRRPIEGRRQPPEGPPHLADAAPPPRRARRLTRSVRS